MTDEEQIRAEFRRRLPKDPEDVAVDLVLAEQARAAELERRLRLIEDYVQDGVDVDSGADILAMVRGKP